MFLFLTVAYRIACKTSSGIDKEACNITQKKKKYFDIDQHSQCGYIEQSHSGTVTNEKEILVPLPRTISSFTDLLLQVKGRTSVTDYI